MTELVDQNNPTIRVAIDVVDWIQQVVPDYRKYAGLWFNRLVLMEKTQQVERAFEELKEFLVQYPAYSSAIYRMGIIKYEQNNYLGSIEYFSKALEINPGLYGAMYMQRLAHEALGNISEATDAIKLLRRKLPYDYGFFQDEATSVA